MTEAPDRCRVCGGGLARRAASEGLCPACLLGEALLDEGDRSAYRIITIVGRDPGGVTYLAETRTGIARRVALKIVGPRPDAETILARYHHWRGEMDALGHPAIRRLLDAGIAGPDQVYLVSEYVLGETLAERLARGPLAGPERLAVASQVSEAVAAAHAAGSCTAHWTGRASEWLGHPSSP